MWLFRLLVRLYPPRFRARYGAELSAAFEEIRLEPRHRGAAGGLRLWSLVAADLLRTSLRLRAQQLHARMTGVPVEPDHPKRSEMETVLQDVWYACRQFARRPGFAAIVVLSLGLGIGGNSLIYGLIDGYVLRPFPYPEPDRLLSVGVTFPKISNETRFVEVLSPAEYTDIRAAESFAATAAFDLGNRNISGGDVPERVFTALVVDDLFPVIGMRPQLGRGFTPEELAPRGPRAAIISNRIWRSRFGADPGVLSRTVRINGEPTPVVGVMPEGLLVIGTDLWLPWGGDVAAAPRGMRQFSILGRLAPGVSQRQANAELATIAAAVDHQHRPSFKEYEGWALTARPWASALMQDFRGAAFLLLGAVGLVLLIACVNLTNLFLARATNRHRELAVRLALGASRTRVARQLLTETMVLAMAGAALGVAFAFAGLQAAPALIPSQLQLLGVQATLNARVLVWCAVMAVATGIVVGLLPAWHAARTDPHEAMKGDARAGGSRTMAKLRGVLVVAQIAVSVALLLGAGLLLRSFANINRVDLGFDPRGVLTQRLTLPRDRYPGDAAGAFFDALVERLRGLPQVRAVSAATQYPPMAAFSNDFTLENPSPPGGGIPTALWTVASATHFDTLGVPLRAGRGFASTDTINSPPVAIVNEAFVRRYLSGRQPLDERFRFGSRGNSPWIAIVGVVADVRNGGPAEPPRPEIFTPVRQQTDWNQLFVMVRGHGEAAGLLPAVREAVRALDPEQPVYAVRSLEDALAESAFQQRVSALLLSAFAAVALTLAAVGIFGVLSFMVSARTQEIGVRLAVGAEPRHVRWMVMKQTLQMAAVGLTLGMVVLAAGGNAVEGLLFGVRPMDPLTVAGVIGLLTGVALTAAWLPALRASRVDPIAALRND
jgi:predicted permease